MAPRTHAPQEFTTQRAKALKARTTILLAAALLSLLAVLLVTSVWNESPTFDEPVHLYAGFEYWHAADFGRNPEHPPLAKLLAAAPLLSLGLHEPFVPPQIPYFKAQDGIGSVHLLYGDGANADRILLRGRMVIACFTLLLGLLVFTAAREMFGDLAALLSLTLFVFEPVVLANGALVTTDMPLACSFFASVYAFYRFGKRPSVPRFLLVALGVAVTLTVKHSGVLILPTLLLLAGADLWRNDQPGLNGRTALSRKRLASLYAVTLLGLMIVAYLSLWAIYGFRFSARPGGLTIAPQLALYAAGLSPLQQSIIGFLAQHHLLPEAYLFGWVDILLIPAYRSSFLLGHVFSSGQWFYLPVLF